MRIEKYFNKNKWRVVSGFLWWKKVYYVSRNKKACIRYLNNHK